MGRRPGPLDQGQIITTYELLDAVATHGPHWPGVLCAYTLEAVSTAVGREITAGNLLDGAHLTPAGTAILERLRAAGAHDDLVVDDREPSAGGG